MPTANLPGIPAGEWQRKAHTLPQYSSSRLLEKKAGEPKWLEENVTSKRWLCAKQYCWLGLPMTKKEKGQCFCPVWMLGDIQVAW